MNRHPDIILRKTVQNIYRHQQIYPRDQTYQNQSSNLRLPLHLSMMGYHLDVYWMAEVVMPLASVHLFPPHTIIKPWKM